MSDLLSDQVRQFLNDPAELDELRNLVGRVHSKAPDLIDREDLFQEVVVRALAAGDTFSGTSRQELLGWLWRIADNLLVDRLRAAARRPPTGPMSAEETGPQEPAEHAVQVRDWITSILSTLTPVEAALLRARYQGGLSFAAIARILETSPGTVRQIHHRLLERLRTRSPSGE
jgi:RNA polymerase sigma-70 factor (ECF subfamily)